MKKYLLKVVVSIGFFAFTLHNASAVSIPGFGGKKQTRAERLQSQLKGAPVAEALALNNEDHVNDGSNSKCLTFRKSGKDAGTFVKMAANGCFPDGTQYSAIANIRKDFCNENCTDGTKPEDKCDPAKDGETPSLCERYCFNTNLGSERAHALLSKCFSAYGLKVPMSFEEAAAYEGKAKSSAAAQKTEAKQSKNELDGYKVKINSAINVFKAYFDALHQFEVEREKVSTAAAAVMEAVKDVQEEKANLIEAQISKATLDKAEKDAMTTGSLSHLGKPTLKPEQVEEIGVLPATETELAEFDANIAGALRVTVEPIVQLANEKKQEVGVDKFKDVVRGAHKQQKLRAAARKMQEETGRRKKVRTAEETFEARDDATKARLRGSSNPLFGRKSS
jgi:hypothetical protein